MRTNETTHLLNGSVKHGLECKQRGPREASRTRRYLVMLAGITLQGVTVGIMFAMAVVYAELVVVFDTNRSQVALIQSVYSGLTTGAGVLLSPIIKRFGPGPSVCVGTIVGALCISSAFAATNVITLIFVVAFLGSFGLSFSYLSSFVSVSWMFHQDPGVAMVVVSIGSSLGQFICPYLMEVFIEEYNWNGAFLLLGGVALQCLPCGCFIYTCKQFYKTDIEESDLSFTKSVKKICDTTLVRDVAILLILLNSFLLAFTGNMEAWYFVDILTSRGYERERGSFLVTMLGFANLIGRITGSIMRIKIKIKTIYHWIYIWPIIGISHILAINILDYGSLLGVCLLYGVALGTCTAQAPAIMFEVCGLARSPQGVALVNLMYGFGNFSCAFLGGVVKDATGQYDSMFYMSAGMAFYISVASAVVAYILRRRERLAGAGQEGGPITKVQYTRLTYGTDED